MKYGISWWMFLFLLLPLDPAAGQEQVSFDHSLWKMKSNREAFAAIMEGHPDTALAMMQRYLEKGADAAEIYYGMSVAWFSKKEPEKGMEYFRKALEAGLPIERFMAGPRSVLQPLYRDPYFLEKTKGKELVDGPLLGCMTANSVEVWVRTFHEVPVVVKVGKNPLLVGETLTFTGKTSSSRDYTVKVQVNGLEPSTEYFYSVMVDGKKGTIRSFRTFPLTGSPSVVKIAFGGGAAYYPPAEKIWKVIRDSRPHLFIGMGDNVYIDHPEMPEVQRFCYYQRESSPPFRKMTAVVPYYAVWDDHDFGKNDAWGGPDPDRPAWKRVVLEVFRENTVNPSYGGGEEHPGTWYKVSVGQVDLFMLDTRYYRTPSWVDRDRAKGAPPPDMLGPVQLAWLKKELKSSSATFKVVVSSVPWSDGAKDVMEGRYDTWRGYAAQRKEIFDFLTQHHIGGVILLSADRHRHDVWRHDRQKDYALYEFTSSRLTNIHYHPLRPGALFGYNEKCGFGMLEFHTEVARPYVIFRIINVDKEVIDEIRIYRYQLDDKFVMGK